MLQYVSFPGSLPDGHCLQEGHVALHAGFLRSLQTPDALKSARCGHVDAMDDAVCFALTHQRKDAFGGELGSLALATVARGKVLVEEKRPPLNALRLFKPYSEVPIGATKYTVPYISYTGEAAIWRSGVNIPKVNVGAFEDEFGVAYLMTSWESSFPESLAAGFAQMQMGLSVNTDANKAKGAVVALDQTANRLFWNGSPENQIYGVLNYPRLQRWSSAVAFDGTAAPTDVAYEITTGFHYAENNSRGAMASNRMACSPRVANYLMSTRLNTVTGQTIGQFLEETLNVKIDKAQELAGIASGVDGILFWNDATENMAVTMIQAPTFLPPVLEGIRTVNYAYSIIGGNLQQIPGSNALMLVNV